MRLSISSEHAFYGTHENGVDDLGYRQFLKRFLDPFLEECPVGEKYLTGLDFGCGPGPALAAMLTEQGADMSLYDPLYYPDKGVLNKQYDFIVSTEVFEHLHDPSAVMDVLSGILMQGGCLGVMTEFLPVEKEKFAQWHYRRDPTHVGFWSERTFAYVAERWGFDVKTIDRRVVLLSKR